MEVRSYIICLHLLSVHEFMCQEDMGAGCLFLLRTPGFNRAVFRLVRV